jgi:hypothetical protein
MNETVEISDEILKDIQEHFKFLFDRGYVVYSGKTHSVEFDAWEVILKHQDYYVKFDEEKGGLDLSFGSPSKGFIAIRALIYFLSKEKDFIGFSLIRFIFFNVMKTEARLLQKHIDKFESGFEREFPKSEEELRLAEEKYYARVR